MIKKPFVLAISALFCFALTACAGTPPAAEVPPISSGSISSSSQEVPENELHEFFGTSLFVLYFLHQAINIKWYRGLLKGKYTLRRIINTAVDGILTVEILALMISGRMISESMIPFLNFGSVSVGRTIHSLVSHWYLLTMAIQVGLHLEMLLAVRHKMLGERKLGKLWRFLVKLFAVGFAVWGGFSIFSLRCLNCPMEVSLCFPHASECD